MIKTSLKADIKVISREPILLLFMVLPVIMFIVFRGIISFGEVYLYKLTNIVLWDYYGYILAGILLITPSMLGTVAGFLMIDERDIKINELISVTPIGYIGYIVNRLIIPFVGSFIYTFCAYYILNLFFISNLLLIYIAILLGLQGIFISFILYRVADDKVKGLTYAKGLNVFIVFAMADLINIPWVIYIAVTTPFYWIIRLIVDENKLGAILISAIVHIVYTTVLVWLGKRV